MLDEIEKSILYDDNRDVYHRHFLGNQVWYFKDYLNSPNPYKDYDDFKMFVAKKLDVHFNNVAIIGSAKSGISLNPSKKLRKFIEDEDELGQKSDMDLVIVSRKYYQLFWEAYLDLFYSRKLYSDNYTTVSKSIFKGFVSVKNLEPIHPFFREWIVKVDSFMKDLQVLFQIQHTVNYRIYRSWEEVERYHQSGIDQLRRYLLNLHKSADLLTEGNKNEWLINYLLGISYFKVQEILELVKKNRQDGESS